MALAFIACEYLPSLGWENQGAINALLLDTARHCGRSAWVRALTRFLQRCFLTIDVPRLVVSQNEKEKYPALLLTVRTQYSRVAYTSPSLVVVEWTQSLSPRNHYVRSRIETVLFWPKWLDDINNWCETGQQKEKIWIAFFPADVSPCWGSTFTPYSPCTYVAIIL
jgi:hypothetical protein